MNCRNDEGKGRGVKGRNREAIRQYDGNTEDAEVWRGRVLLFPGVWERQQMCEQTRVHIHINVSRRHAGRASHP